MPKVTSLSLALIFSALLGFSFFVHAGTNPYTWRHATVDSGGGAFDTDGGMGPYAGVTSTGQGEAIGAVADSGGTYDDFYGFLGIRRFESTPPVSGDFIFEDRFEEESP